MLREQDKQLVEPDARRQLLSCLQGVQKNRNPFVDYPGLERYIWGDMQNVPFSYDNYQTPTSIITVNAPTTPRPVRIYTISGTLVRTTNDADRALDGLNKGIYIVNGKKYVVQ